MDQVHRLNEAEIADALSGKPAEKRIADCADCAAEFAEWRRVGEGFRRDLDSCADLPPYFWARQQARISDRLAARAPSLRWATAAIFALVLLAFGLIHHSTAPTMDTTRSAPEDTKVQMAQSDPDDLLLQDIQASLDRDVPAPLAPASVLVNEMASSQTQHVKEN